MVAGYGFLLNNQMTDFNPSPRQRGRPDQDDYDPGANDVAPGKRPRSSMAPTIIFARGAEGERPVAAFGSPGGATIINTLLSFTLDLVDHHMPLPVAVQQPRLSMTRPADDASAVVEAGFPEPLLEHLRSLGYSFGKPEPIGAVQAVAIDPTTGAAQGAADPRRDGTVVALPAPGSVR
jgi:gamma-glutamyltranspeptidase/glutathione hydrolase